MTVLDPVELDKPGLFNLYYM